MLMRPFFLAVLSLWALSGSAAVVHEDTLSKKSSSVVVVNEPVKREFCSNVVGLINPKTSYNENYIFDHALYDLGTDTLPQIKFWRSIMNLHQDSAIMSISSNRSIVQKVCAKQWDCQNDSVKKVYRDSVRLCRNLDSTHRVLFTAGKKFFYDFDKASQNFHRGINCFIDNGVDPWFAQAILLIESPNKLQKSNVGAYGPFQLMKDVARMYGLKVNKQIDERADFDRSAYAASSLIKRICIPLAHKMLDSLRINSYKEDELWFRLLVMHIYHAGAYNVQNALFASNPSEGNMSLIYNLWRTQTGRFKSASQNYSQLIIAAMLEMNERKSSLLAVKSK